MSIAADFMIGPSQEIIIAGDASAENTNQMLKLVGKYFLPNSIVIFHPTGRDGKKIEALCPFLEEYKFLSNKTVAFICKDYTCQAPVYDVKAFKTNIEKLAGLI